MALRKAIQDEIREYPTPIAGCDQQFNDLLERRNRIAAEANAISQALARGDTSLATRIVRSSAQIHDAIKTSFLDENPTPDS